MHDDSAVLENAALKNAALKNKVERLVLIAAGGKLGAADLAATGGHLREAGLDSLGYLNLFEGIERTFGVAIDLDSEPDHTFVHSIDNLVRYLGEKGVVAA